MKLPMFRMYSEEDDVEAVVKVIKRGYNWACGSEIEEFENKIAEYIGIRHCTVFNSGTSALHAVMLAYEIKKGDEVIVPSFTFIATVNAALFVGATPVFADIEEQTFGLDPKDVERKITKKTRAIIAVHYAGCPCKIEDLRKIADKYKLVLIEDATEAMGAKIGNKMIGTIGDSAVFSFCQNKIITTGEGGAVVTNDKNIQKKLKLILSHGREEGDYFSGQQLDYVSLGYNFRMASMNASLGISQLKKIDKMINIRLRIADQYKSRLSKISEISMPSVPSGCKHVYQLFTIVVKNKRIRLSKYLAKNGIANKVYFDPVHFTKFYKKKGITLPNTERISKEVLSLPMHPLLNKDDIDFIADKIIEFFKS